MEIDENDYIYQINTEDIWLYEQGVYFSDQQNVKLTRNFLDKLRTEIMEYGISEFTSADFDKGDNAFKKVYQERIDGFMDNQNNIEAQFILGYFFSPDFKCYQYYQPIEVYLPDTNYDYWFSMKLRQYENNIKEISNFLYHQAETNFEGDYDSYFKFLRITIRQFSDILSEKVRVTAEEWLEATIKSRKLSQKNLKKDISTEGVLDKKITKPTLKKVKNVSRKNKGLEQENSNQKSDTPISKESQESEENDFALSTIEDSLSQFKDLMPGRNYDILIKALLQYFNTGKFPLLEKIIVVKKMNIKRFGWALNEIYKNFKSDKFPVEYMLFAKKNISLFVDVEYDEKDVWNSNLYKYFKNNPDRKS